MLSSLFGSIIEVIQISKDDASKIMENIIHGSLKCSTCVIESKRHDTISKGTPRGSKRGFILICWMYLDLIVAEEPIHKGQCLMADTVINNLVDERGWKFVFGTSMVEIMKFCADVNSALFFFNGDGVGYPRSVHNGVNDPNRM
jgi:hypothetical protein